MRPIDPQKMREMEATGREIGKSIGRAIDVMPGGRKKYGFTLLLFSYEGAELTYISSAQRQDMINTMQEMISKLRSEEPGTSSSRN